MSREKFSWLCAANAWLPVMAALATLALLPAASAPRIIAASIQGASRSWLATMRAMCRCATWLSSCAITDASSSGRSVIASSPRFTPM